MPALIAAAIAMTSASNVTLPLSVAIAALTKISPSEPTLRLASGSVPPTAVEHHIVAGVTDGAKAPSTVLLKVTAPASVMTLSTVSVTGSALKISVLPDRVIAPPLSCVDPRAYPW
ncbi:MAG: hypothetical protein R3F53_21640 [Gammaproteobacteria bacterium]